MVNDAINEVKVDCKDVRVAFNSAELLLLDNKVFNVANDAVASVIAVSTAPFAALVVVAAVV